MAWLGVAAAGLAFPVQAQTQPGAQPAEAVPKPFLQQPGTLAAGTPQSSPPDEAAGREPLPVRRAWSIVPRISLAETLTDNVAPATGIRRGDLVTEVIPGIRIDGDGARLKVHLDYQLRQLFYAKESGRRNTQNYLNAFGTLEAVEKWLFVDVGGIVTQQELSPFSFQSASNVTVNANRVETSRFRISPYVRGSLADAADYEVRYNRSATRTDSALVLDQDIDEWRGTLKGRTSWTTVGWGLDASHREIDYKGGRRNEEDRYRGLLTYRFTPEFNVSASAGQEANNFLTPGRETHGTHGYGFEWKPSERTHVTAFRERRFFGDGHAVSLAYRTALSALKFTDTRDVSVLPGRLANFGFGSNSDLLTRTDTPEERARVEELLTRMGISLNGAAASGFVTSRVVVERRRELSYAIQWARDMVTLAAFKSEQEGVGLASGVDIFSTSRHIGQRGFSINYGHRLTPLTNLNVLAARQNSKGTGTTGLSSELKYLQAGVTTRLGPGVSASLGVRRALFESSVVRPYTENALLGSLSAQY